MKTAWIGGQLAHLAFDEAMAKKRLEEDIEYDLYVRMPPIRQYKIWVTVKSVERAKPRIIEEPYDL